jgi:hypothetical protein
MWQGVIDVLVVANSGKHLQIIIWSNDGVQVWVFISFMGHLLVSCLNHIWHYMLGMTTIVQLMKNLVVVVIYEFL